MINVLFFASLKESLDCDALQVASAEAATIAGLRQLLAAKGALWAASLEADAALVAVNQTMANEQTTLKSGDEVAFFPPVTGG